MPSIVGKNGFETHVPIALNKEEIENLQKSAAILKGILKENNLL